jgi:hypothetical protein
MRNLNHAELSHTGWGDTSREQKPWPNSSTDGTPVTHQGQSGREAFETVNSYAFEIPMQSDTPKSLTFHGNSIFTAGANTSAMVSGELIPSFVASLLNSKQTMVLLTAQASMT